MLFRLDPDPYNCSEYSPLPCLAWRFRCCEVFCSCKHISADVFYMFFYDLTGCLKRYSGNVILRQKFFSSCSDPVHISGHFFTGGIYASDHLLEVHARTAFFCTVTVLILFFYCPEMSFVILFFFPYFTASLSL